MSSHSARGRPWRRARDQAKRGTNTCYICGQVIDYTLPKRDPMSYQLDHVVPVNRGGTNEPHNRRPSHRRCNRAKSDKTHAPIIRRSGSLA